MREKIQVGLIVLMAIALAVFAFRGFANSLEIDRLTYELKAEEARTMRNYNDLTECRRKLGDASVTERPAGEDGQGVEFTSLDE